MPERFTGAVLRRGDAEYERARAGAVWNARLPERYPAVIVQAAGEDDVVRALRMAAGDGKKVRVRSGGHSWSGSHLRDGAMLLDLSRLGAVAIDRESRTAVVEPGA